MAPDTPEIFSPRLELWRLTPDGGAFASRWGAQLLPVLHDGAPAMLKLAAGEEEQRGVATLSWFGGEGAVRVFAAQADAVLMERAAGPLSLAAMALRGEDDLASRILCQTAARLHAPRAAPPPKAAVPLGEWFRALWPAADRYGGTFAAAAQTARQLLAEPRDVVVLHGDLHHDNVLDGGPRGWLAIDPKGLIGERGFEFANLFRNPDAETALSPGRMARQIEVVCAAAGLERVRLTRWILAYAGLGAAWSLSSGQDHEPGLAIAECAASLI